MRMKSRRESRNRSSRNQRRRRRRRRRRSVTGKRTGRSMESWNEC
jgi:hypothetical protein